MDMQKEQTAVLADQSAVPEAVAADGLPDGFFSRQDGIYQATGANDTEAIWLCSPMSVIALLRDPAGKGWGRIIELVDPEGRTKQVEVLDREIEKEASAVRAKLVDHGLKLASRPKARAAFMDLVQNWRPEKTLTSTDRLGWTDDTCSGFVLASGEVLGAGGYHLVGHDWAGTAPGSFSAGTVQSWRCGVGALCTGNPLLMVSVSLAFAGPLLQLLGEEGGGIHLRGASSCGKTTIQKVATSVWRNPACIGTWRATANGVEEIAKASNSTLLSLDEIAEVDARELDSAAYMLANGIGKARAKASGGAAPRAAWHVAILSTGEISLAEKLVEARRRVMDGQNVRLVDIEADSGDHGAFDSLHGHASGTEFSDALKHAAATDYGTVGPAFVEYLLQHRFLVAESARKFIVKAVKQWQGRSTRPDEGQVQRVARRLAVMACAGELATTAGLTGWEKGAALRAAQEVFDLWQDARAAVGIGEGSSVVERTRAFLRVHADGFVESTAGASIREPEHGWKDAGLFYIKTASWQDLHGKTSAEAARELLRLGLLSRGEGTHLAKRAPRWIKERPRVYAVLAEIVADDRPVSVATIEGPLADQPNRLAG